MKKGQIPSVGSDGGFGGVRKRSLGRIAVLKMIERELKNEIAWINSHQRPLGGRMEAARYAYRKAIKIVQKHYVILSAPNDV